tara:strand:+ start:1777 stop:1956 length:180 start_codon:yes stop_codon:yes gene_type:complete
MSKKYKKIVRDPELTEWVKLIIARNNKEELTQQEIEDMIYCGFDEYARRYCLSVSRTLH